MKRDLTEAGYRGEPIVVLAVSGNSSIVSIAQVGADQLRKAGINVDLQTMDVGTMMRRRTSKALPDKGGWNVYFTILNVLFNTNPATNAQIRGDGMSGVPGWPDSPKLEGCAKRGWKRGMPARRSVSVSRCRCRCGGTYHISQWGIGFGRPVHRRNIVDLPWGFAAFYGVRRVLNLHHWYAPRSLMPEVMVGDALIGEVK